MSQGTPAPEAPACSGNAHLSRIRADLQRQLRDVQQEDPEYKSLAEAIGQVESLLARPLGGATELERLIEAARLHGEDSEPDHEVGDLQDLLRPMWEMLTPAQRSLYLQLPAVSGVLEGAGYPPLVNMHTELMQDDWENVCEYFGLDTSFQYSDAEAADYMNRYILATNISLGGRGRYVHGVWGHIFGAGMPETNVRVAIDTQDNTMVAMQIQRAGGADWKSSTKDQRDDVLNSMLEANDALADPADWGLKRGDALPSWAVAVAGESLAPFEVKLANRGNPDHDQDPDSPVYGTPSDEWVSAQDFKDAARLCRRYIEEHGLGGGNWAGGDIRDRNRTIVARVSYNGRVWDSPTPGAAQATRERGG